MRWSIGLSLMLGCGSGSGGSASCKVETDGQIAGIVLGDSSGWSNVRVTAKGDAGTGEAFTEADGTFVMEVVAGTYTVEVPSLTEPHTGCCGYENCRTMKPTHCTADDVRFEGKDCLHLD